MGLFDWLRRQRRLRTICWFDEERAAEGLVADVRADLAAGRHVVVVAHFEHALIDTGRRLAAAGIGFDTLARWQAADAERLRGAPPRVVAMLAKALPGDDGAPTVRAAGPLAASVRVRELHVLAEANQRVQQFCDRLPVPATVTAYLGLDAPHIARTIGAGTRSVLGRFGMAHGAPIDSAMVGNAIRRALVKLAKKVTGDRPARSLAEWLRLNLPQ